MCTPKFVRVLALGVMLFCIGVFVWSLVLFPTTAETNLDFVRPQNNWTNAVLRAAIDDAGFTIGSLAYFHLATILLPTFFYLVVAGIIYARRSSDWFSLYLCVLFVVFGTVANTLSRLAGNLHPVMGMLISALGNSGWIGLLPVFYLFPDGKFVPRWTRWMFVLWAAFVALVLMDTSGFVKGVAETSSNSLLNVIGIPLVLVMFIVAVVSQVYRYFRHSNTMQRQQTKWVLGAIILFVASVVISLASIGLSQPGQHFTANDLRVNLVFDILFAIVGALFPIAIGIAILRYRLWDIDILIRRTVTYAAVVALLLIVYFGSVILLQQVFASVTGERSEIITALSTLAIAALFVPLRNRIQSAIDRRFNRKKYDAQQVLQKFGETVRDETDLEKLTSELVNVVQETMQPKSVTLWLKKEERGEQKI